MGMPDSKNYDLKFTPQSYWGPQDVKTHFGSRIKGELRRKAAIKELGLGVADEGMLKSSLEEDERSAVGRDHPWFMGGEYLPDLRSNEVEIARVVLESTTMDVISIRARHTKNRIKYSVVDEYDSKFEFSPKSSKKPLALGQIINLVEEMTLDGDSASPSAYRDSQGLDEVELIKEMKSFVSVSSQFYADLHPWFERDAEIWASDRLKELPVRLKKKSDAISNEVIQAQINSEKNDPLAMLSLGYWHFIGRGVEHSREKAISLWTQAADLGNARALFNLAVCYHDGLEVNRNQERALELYELLAEDGYYLGLKMAAFCRRTGIGCQKNIEKALKWNFKIAKGFGPERFDDGLVNCLRNMNGKSNLEKKAIKWIRDAANLGAAGQNMLNSLSQGKTDEPISHNAGIGYLGVGELIKFPPSRSNSTG